MFVFAPGSPTTKGAIAELKIASAAAQLGIVVAWPLMEGRRYDLIFDTGPELYRVQCKSASRHGDVVRVLTRTSRLTSRGHVRTTYTADEIDAVAAYCEATDECYFLPIAEIDGQSMVHLRLQPARNNQTQGVKMAVDYRLGAIAQLGERVTGSHEVAGSSPASSTAEQAAHQGGLFSF